MVKKVGNTSMSVVGEDKSVYVYNCDECDRFGCKFMYYFISNRHGKIEQN
ncbi:hypothetical protein BH18THE2_BH18THE2_10880 [soil metagenome]